MRSVFYIDKNTIYFYGAGLNKIATFKMPESVIYDMEILNENDLENIIKKLKESLNFQHINTLLCLSKNSYFEEEVLPHFSMEEVKKIQSEFEETVPFENVVSKYYIQENKSKIIAINFNFIQILINILKKNGFIIDGIIPDFALYKNNILSFNEEVASEILKNYKLLSEVSFLENKEKDTNDNKDSDKNNAEIINTSPEFKVKPSKNNMRVYGLSAVFAVLLILLFVVYSTRSGSKIAKNNTVVVPLEKKEAASTETQARSSVEAAQTSHTALNKDNFVIEVSLSQDKLQDKDLIVKTLNEVGFNNVVVNTLSATYYGNSTAIFKNYFPINIRSEIITALEKNGFSITQQESIELVNDALIRIF